MILSIKFKEITIWNGTLIYVIRCVSFTFYLCWRWKKALKDALRFETDVVLNIFCLVDFTFMDRPMMKKVWREFHFNKYKLMGFRINVFKADFADHYFVFVYSKHFVRTQWGTDIRQQHWSNLHKHHFSDFGEKLFWILTVGSISLGNCRFLLF